jgi:PAS domain S-box-containing protein
VTRVSVGPADVLAVLGRIHRCSDLEEALSTLLDAVCGGRPVNRAAALVLQGEELKALVGVGWDAAELRTRSVSIEDGESPTARAFRDLVPVTDAGASAGRFQVALPLYAAGRSGGAFGVLELEAEESLAAQVEELDALLRAVAPVAHRVGEMVRAHQVGSQLERQREILTSIINALPDPVLVTDAENNVLLENLRAEQLFNPAEEDSPGRRRALDINNLLLSSFLTRSVMGGAGSGPREINLVDPSEGTDLLFEVLSTTLPAALAGEGAVVSVLRNITDLRRAATELEQQFKRVRQAEVQSSRERDRLNLILENVGDPILVTDGQSNLILMNPEAERLFEASAASDPRSRHRREVRANDTRFTSFVSDFALSSDVTRTAEMRLTDPDSGRDFPAEVLSGKILNERGETTAIVSIVHDLTQLAENKRMAGELAELNEGLEERIRRATEQLAQRNQQLEWQSQELERAYRLKSQFLASMSHELRTPINALLGYTSLMRDRIYGELAARQEEALDRMYSASQHLLELVNDILDLAKIEAGKMPVHIEPVDLHELLEELHQTIEPMLAAKALEFSLELPDDVPLLETDRTKIKQVFLNLLSNAVKFTHRGEVGVRARHEGSLVRVEVWDSGIGIAEEDLDKIFEDFRQVDQSSTREYGGTGLGLSITRKLLYLLGGTIEVESELGDGSVFVLTLPLRSDEIVVEEEDDVNGSEE